MCLHPPDRDDAPAITSAESGEPVFRPGRTQVISHRLLVGQEFRCYHCADRVASGVFRACSAAAVAKKPVTGSIPQTSSGPPSTLRSPSTHATLPDPRPAPDGASDPKRLYFTTPIVYASPTKRLPLRDHRAFTNPIIPYKTGAFVFLHPVSHTPARKTQASGSAAVYVGGQRCGRDLVHGRDDAIAAVKPRTTPSAALPLSNGEVRGSLGEPFDGNGACRS